MHRGIHNLVTSTRFMDTPNFKPLIDCLTFSFFFGNMKKNISFNKVAIVDAADYGHPKNHVQHAILSPVPEVSYKDLSPIVGIP